ncbi:MAG: PEP-utilizing enzyme [Candidatus Andersenbacteria bacterium]
MKWINIISRYTTPLQWSAQIHQIQEGITVGPIFWRYSKRLVIKYKSPLTRLFAYTGDSLETNIQGYLKEPNETVIRALEVSETAIEQDLQLVPAVSVSSTRHFYNRFRYEMSQMIMAYNFALITREVLEQHIGSEKLKDIDKEVMQPYRDTTFILENKELIKAQRAYKSGKFTEKEGKDCAENLARKFGFLHAEYAGNPWIAADYLREIVKGHSSKKEIHTSSATDKSFSNYDEYTQWLIITIQRWIYVFDESKNALVRANWALRETLHALKIEDQPILNCTEEEFLEWVSGGELPPREILNSRNQYYAARLWEGKIEEFSTQADIEKIIKEEQITEFEVAEKGVTELRGQAAFKGVVKGKVRLVLSPSDVEKVSEGDILVASMTTPGMIQGMRKAAAFVTDEGGVLCHAAIVAREFKKPCIIGTKKATAVLKNGEEVEVDATIGVVKIIK